MKGYILACKYIADNDDPLTLDIKDIKDYISVHLLAYLFDKSEVNIAWDVLGFRTGRITVTQGNYLRKIKEK